MTAVEQIRDDKRQNHRKEVAARSFEKEIWERNNKHCSSKTTPESAALKEHQHAKKCCNCIEHVAGGSRSKIQLPKLLLHHVPTSWRRRVNRSETTRRPRHHPSEQCQSTGAETRSPR